VRYWRDELSASVLVLAHHGSRTSTSHALLKWVGPEWALISAGRGNAFGHPHREVIDRVRQTVPVGLLDTSKDGAISISSTDQQGLQLSRERTAWSPYWLKLP
jgi:competence protein ComEC